MTESTPLGATQRHTVARGLDRPGPDGWLLAAAGELTRAVQALPASGLGGPPWTHDDRGGALPAVEDAWWHAAEAAVPLGGLPRPGVVLARAGPAAGPAR